MDLNLTIFDRHPSLVLLAYPVLPFWIGGMAWKMGVMAVANFIGVTGPRPQQVLAWPTFTYRRLKLQKAKRLAAQQR